MVHSFAICFVLQLEKPKNQRTYNWLVARLYRQM